MADNSGKKYAGSAKPRSQGGQQRGAGDFYGVFTEFVKEQGSDKNYVIVEAQRLLDAIRTRSGKKWKANRLPVGIAVLAFANKFMLKKSSARFQPAVKFLCDTVIAKTNELHGTVHETFRECAAPEQLEQLEFPPEYIVGENIENAALEILIEREIGELEKIKEVLGENMPTGLESQLVAQFRKAQNLIKQPENVA